MKPAKICSFCNRSEVKFFHLEDSIRAPNDLHFEGHTNLQSVLEKILHKRENDGKTTNEICQKCHEKMHGIYSFIHQRTESEKKFHQTTDVTVRLEKLTSCSILTDFKTEFKASAETDEDSPKCSSTICDNSAVSDVVVKIECENNFEDRIDFNKVTRDNIDLLGEKCSNSADSGSVEQNKSDSMDSEDAEQITIQDEIIKEEWTMQEDILEVNANHDVTDKEQTKLSNEICDKPSHADVEFKCDQCDAKYKSSRGLKDHQMFHTGVTFTCNQCDVSFFNKSNLTQHLRGVHTDVVFPCDHCDATYKTKGALKVHRQIHNGILFNCDQCDAKYKTARGLRDHKMSHTGVTFPCNQCDASFFIKGNLSHHLRRVHTDEVFPCDHCDATYKTNGALNVHRQIHNGILFNCDQCDAKYKTARGLRDHKMSHTGVTFTCNQCNASFSTKGNLSKHLRRVHTDSVFSCDHCDATYKSKQALNLHKQFINGIFFNCDQCNASYKSKRALNAHKQKHS